MDNAGTHALVILSQDRLILPIGKLGTYNFPSGYYIYVGSALRGLDGRLKRHLRVEKLLHWHIDYLLLQTRIIQIWYSLCNERLECEWNTILSELPGATPFIPGFGSSDCRCRTHLTYFLTTPPFDSFRQELNNRVQSRVHQLII
jgi:Uri superfamily endonuclease